jgi:hypothetical protein
VDALCLRKGAERQASTLANGDACPRQGYYTRAGDGGRTAEALLTAALEELRQVGRPRLAPRTLHVLARSCTLHLAPSCTFRPCVSHLKARQRTSPRLASRISHSASCILHPARLTPTATGRLRRPHGGRGHGGVAARPHASRPRRRPARRGAHRRSAAASGGGGGLGLGAAGGARESGGAGARVRPHGRSAWPPTHFRPLDSQTRSAPLFVTRRAAAP